MKKRLQTLGMITAVSLLAAMLGMTLLAEAASVGPPALVVSAMPNPVQRGEQLTYAVMATNRTTETQRIEITSQLPENSVLQGVSPNAEIVMEMGVETAVRLIVDDVAINDSEGFLYTVSISGEAFFAVENETTLLLGKQMVTETTSIPLGDALLFLPLVYRDQCAGDQSEPNNDPAEAEMRDPLPADSPLVASFCGEDDDDWYQIEVEASGDIQIDLAVEAAQDLDLFLYASDNGMFSIIDSSNVTGFGTDEQIEMMIEAGTYYIRVFPFMPGTDDSVTYELSWTQP